jgi:hypothetical protein
VGESLGSSAAQRYAELVFLLFCHHSFHQVFGRNIVKIYLTKGPPSD